MVSKFLQKNPFGFRGDLGEGKKHLGKKGCLRNRKLYKSQSTIFGPRTSDPVGATIHIGVASVEAVPAKAIFHFPAHHLAYYRALWFRSPC